MNESDLLKEEPSLFDQLCSTLYLGVAFKQVKKNKGKPGIDGITIADFETRLDETHHLIIVDGEVIKVSQKGREYQQWRGPLPELPLTKSSSGAANSASALFVAP